MEGIGDNPSRQLLNMQMLQQRPGWAPPMPEERMGASMAWGKPTVISTNGEQTAAAPVARDQYKIQYLAQMLERTIKH